MRTALNRQVTSLYTMRHFVEMARGSIEGMKDDVTHCEESIEGMKDLHTWSCLHECAVTTAS